MHKRSIMKKLLIFCCITSIIAAGCSKSSDNTSNNENIVNNPDAVRKPVAAFSINNATGNVIGEGRILEISNQSENATAYSWDFGDGTTSSEAAPTFYYPMHGNYHVTLKVTASNGKTSEMSTDLTVFCGRTVSNHSPLTGPVL